MNYSPLRYPGGKNKISPFVKLIIDKSGLTNITYVEPFAGGAGVALSLLFSGTVNHIVINDYDKCIYSVWRAILNDTNEFIKLIKDTDVTIEEWRRQKDIYLTQNNKYSLELAFATFFLNRTNRSGILKAGPIGGFNQNGNYLIDARFDKDHQEISECVKQLTCNWIITYDNTAEITKLYEEQQCGFFDLSYSLANNLRASELIVLSNDTLWPTEAELAENDININLRRM